STSSSDGRQPAGADTVKVGGGRGLLATGHLLPGWGCGQAVRVRLQPGEEPRPAVEDAITLPGKAQPALPPGSGQRRTCKPEQQSDLTVVVDGVGMDVGRCQYVKHGASVACRTEATVPGAPSDTGGYRLAPADTG